jgi:hypothetical protein
VPAGPPNGQHSLEEFEGRLAELEMVSRNRSSLPDRVVSRVGEIETILGFLIFVLTPLDVLSLALSTIGALTWTHDKFIKGPRERRERTERNRQIDLIRPELDRLKRQ